MTQLTQDILEMLFDELGEEVGMTFSQWVASSGYTSSWTDQQIYNALPAGIQAYVLDIGMNWSWLHDGM